MFCAAGTYELSGEPVAMAGHLSLPPRLTFFERLDAARAVNDSLMQDGWGGERRAGLHAGGILVYFLVLIMDD